MNPFPTVEEAFSRVRQEEIRQSVMLNKEETTSPMVMLVKERGRPEEKAPVEVNLTLSKPNQHHYQPNQNHYQPNQNHSWPPPTGLCTHCGGAKHTKENCFKLKGYPDWYKDLKKKKQQTYDGNKGKAALASGGNVSLVPLIDGEKVRSDEGNSLCIDNTHSGFGFNTCERNFENWVIDSGASDHMTFSETDLVEYTEPRKREIVNANGKSSPLTGAGTVCISPSMNLTNTLLVPTLSTKLLSVEQLCEDLNCAVLMYSNFCLFQDIITKKIIGVVENGGGCIT